MEWRREEILILINAYQRNPSLWNTNLKEYKNKYTRFAALNRLQEELSVVNDKITHEDIKKKIHTLRGQYKREKKAKRELDKAGAETSDMYMPKLWCYDLLNFLEDENSREDNSSLDYIESQPATCFQEIGGEARAATVDPLSAPWSTGVTGPCAALPLMLPSDSPASSQHSWTNTPMTAAAESCTRPELQTSSLPPPAKRRKKWRKNEGEEVTNALFDASETRLWAPRGGDDEFRAYGRSLGFDLRSINKKNPLQAKLARKIIGEILFFANTDGLDVESKILNIKPSDNCII